MQPRRRVRAARWLVATALVPAIAGCAPNSVTEQGKAAHNLYLLFLYIAAVVYVVVAALVIWSVVRYRRRGDELPKQTHGNNKLELAWTLIPTVIVLVLFVFTLQAQNKILDNSGQADVNITVTAFQWSWRFTYEGTGAVVLGTPEQIPEMVVPVGQRVRVKLVSADVVHSFYVPQTLFKRQAIPGVTNEFDLTFEKTGLFHGQCTQFCGLQHTDMVLRVRVVSPSEYQSWLAAASRRGSAGQPGT
ncbi:MAG TPA: cytochrome c oxidase subunit II [Actinomycetota bacterium]|nr:cytochrome c oxidase subunit II [Actinomycetota bacterium]